MAETDSTLPPKLYFRIGEVAQLVGVEPHVLRYWEREFRTIRPTKSAKGQRVYSRRDVEALIRVRDLLYRDRFTIAGARKRLRVASEPAPNAEHASRAAPLGSGEREPADSEGAAGGAAPPARPTVEANTSSHAREELRAMRAEIRAFLAEIDPSRR